MQITKAIKITQMSKLTQEAKNIIFQISQSIYLEIAVYRTRLQISLSSQRLCCFHPQIVSFRSFLELKGTKK